ncbi:MAG: mandelate racemase/muconate lactonizing enzyme family protein [Dehalococcoidales bacterium]|nr:mandelate racemase/muconate lactonizing enzyme family protein [Dehalococcoidales bacterium]
MKTITGIGWHGYAVPFRKRFVNAGFTADTRFGLLIFVRTGDGLIGTGEASPVGAGSPAEVEGIAAALHKVAPRMVDIPLDAADRLIVEGLPAPLAFGLETALKDVRGQESGVPLTKLFGGMPTAVPVNALVVSESPKKAAAEAAAAVASGFNCIKLKVGKNTLEEDESVIATVRQAVGPEVLLRVDANQAWSVERAIEAIQLFSLYKIEYVEQPVKADNIAGMARVREMVRVPLAADESLGSYLDLHRLFDAGAADIFIVKAARLGGFRKSLLIAKEAMERGHRVVITSSLESGIGIAAAAHMAAALPPQPKAHGLATALLLENDLLDGEWLPAKGFLEVPDKPGLGFKVDAASLKKYSSGVIGSAGSPVGLEVYLAGYRPS